MTGKFLGKCRVYKQSKRRAHKQSVMHRTYWKHKSVWCFT